MMWEKNEIKNIAKLTSYGAYLDCDFTTAKYPNEEEHIVGDLAEYVYDLEKQLVEKDKEIADLHTTINQDIVQIMMLKDEIEKRRTFIDERIEEKDKEIEITKKLLEAYKQQCHELLKNETEIRHIICDEIRYIVMPHIIDRYGYDRIDMDLNLFNIKLDQVEKGEGK